MSLMSLIFLNFSSFGYYSKLMIELGISKTNFIVNQTHLTHQTHQTHQTH